MEIIEYKYDFLNINKIEDDDWLKPLPLPFPRWCYYQYWQDLYYRTKRGIKMCIKYSHITTTMVTWDYESILRMLKFQLSILKNAIEFGNEEEVSRNEKVKNMERAIFLLERIIDDDYSKVIDNKFWDKYIPFTKEITVEDKKYFKEVRKQADELYIKEWNEFWDILRGDMKNNKYGLNAWWD